MSALDGVTAALDAALAARRFPWTDGGDFDLVTAHVDAYAKLPDRDALTLALYEKLRSANYDQFMECWRLFFPIPPFEGDAGPSEAYYASFAPRLHANPGNLGRLLNIYDEFRKYADAEFGECNVDVFHGLLFVDTYPPAIAEAVFEAALNSNLINFEFIEKIGCFDLAHVNRFVKSIVREGSRPLQFMASVYPVDETNMAALVHTLRVWAPKLEALGVDMPVFLRGVVMHGILSKVQSTTHYPAFWKVHADEEYVRLLMYSNARELHVRVLLESLPRFSPSYATAMGGLNPSYIKDPRFELDRLYLKYC